MCEYKCKEPICASDLMGLPAHIKVKLLEEKKCNEISMCRLPVSKKSGSERCCLGVNSSSEACCLWLYFQTSTAIQYRKWKIAFKWILKRS